MRDETPHIERNLNSELESLMREPGWQAGHIARTLVKNDELRIVLIAMKAQSRIPAHQAEGRIAIQTLRGRVHVHADERRFDLPTGNLMTLPGGVRHDVEASEDSAFLLTIITSARHSALSEA